MLSRNDVTELINYLNARAKIEEQYAHSLLELQRTLTIPNASSDNMRLLCNMEGHTMKVRHDLESSRMF